MQSIGWDGTGWVRLGVDPTRPASELRPTTTTFQMLLGREPPKAMRVKYSWLKLIRAHFISPFQKRNNSKVTIVLIIGDATVELIAPCTRYFGVVWLSPVPLIGRRQDMAIWAGPDSDSTIASPTGAISAAWTPHGSEQDAGTDRARGRVGDTKTRFD